MCASNGGQNTLSIYIHTHTHTHTHIYIYIYIYIQGNRHRDNYDLHFDFISLLTAWIWPGSFLYRGRELGLHCSCRCPRIWRMWPSAGTMLTTNLNVSIRVLSPLTMLNTCSLITRWRIQMETFSALLALCEEKPPITGGFPSQKPVTRSCDVFFNLRLNKLLNKQSISQCFETTSRLLWRHCSEIIFIGWSTYVYVSLPWM